MGWGDVCVCVGGGGGGVKRLPTLLAMLTLWLFNCIFNCLSFCLVYSN